MWLTINALQLFDEVYVTTKGGPLHSTTVLVYYLYQQAFAYFHAGYAAAIACVLFVVIVARHGRADARQPRPRPGATVTMSAPGRPPPAASALGLAPGAAAPGPGDARSRCSGCCVTSLSTLAETRRFPPGLPSSLHWVNFAHAWTDSPLGRWLLNSTIVSVTCVVSNLVLCSLAGYAFARLHFPGSRLLFLAAAGHADGALPGGDDPDAADRQAPRPRRHPAGADRARTWSRRSASTCCGSSS